MTTPISTKLAARTLSQAGQTRAQIAESYGVSLSTVGRWLVEAKNYAAAETTAVATTTVKKVKTKTKKSKAKKARKVVTTAPIEVAQEVDSDVEYRVLATRKSISLTKLVNGLVDDSVVIDKTAGNFQQVFDLIANNGFSEESLEQAYHLCQPKKLVEGFTRGRFKVDVKKGQIVYTPEQGVPFEVSHKLTSRIIDTITKDGVEGADALMNFLDRLMLNPSNRSVNELYGFIQHNDIVITPKGTFYAWKVVRDTYFDKHSNTMDNSVGNEVRVARNQVNEDSDVTCSYGLHVCARSYISHFGSNGDRVVRVEVDPIDVVAVPKDYSDSKMRCAGYIVESDVTDTFFSDLNTY